MNSSIKNLLCILLLVTALGCKHSAKDQNDSLRSEALLFLKKNLKNTNSEEVYFTNREGNEVNLDLSSIKSDDHLTETLKAKSLESYFRLVKDDSIITTGLLDENANLAINDWKRYSWNKNVPKEVFLNYLLPYKVYGESPSRWRHFFKLRYADSINSFINSGNRSAESIYQTIITSEVSSWFKYSTRFTALSNYPSLTELNTIKQGDCFRMAYLNVYILRSLGIPATVDIVPLWGTRNGGHAIDVFYRHQKQPDGKSLPVFKPMIGQYLIRPPKTFRMTFKKANLWTDSIQPILGDNEFVLASLKGNDNLLDVTDNYTETRNITYKLKNKISTGLAYICVYNFGDWRPVFYGKIDTENKAHFNNMAVNMLYQIALPNRTGYTLIDKPFFLDRSGRRTYSVPDFSNKKSLDIKNIDNSDTGWIKKNRSYVLSVLNDNGRWVTIQRRNSISDSLMNFTKVPSNAFYMVNEAAAVQNKSRPFLYLKGKQYW